MGSILDAPGLAGHKEENEDSFPRQWKCIACIPVAEGEDLDNEVREDGDRAPLENSMRALLAKGY